MEVSKSVLHLEKTAIVKYNKQHLTARNTVLRGGWPCGGLFLHNEVSCV